MKDITLEDIIEDGQVEGKISFITSIDNVIRGNIEQEITTEKFIPVLPLRGIMLLDRKSVV